MFTRPQLMLALLALLASPIYAAAQTYPTKPIRFLVPFGPGGSVDLVARVIGDKMQEEFGQPVVIENRFGASEMLATDILAKSPPDGYTILLMTSTFAVNETFQRSRPYNSDRDFAPVAKLVDLPFIMLVTPTLPVKSVQELVAYAKANPTKLNYAHIGLGTPHHLIMEWFKQVAKIEAVGIAYKSSAPGLAAARYRRSSHDGQRSQRNASIPGGREDASHCKRVTKAYCRYARAAHHRGIRLSWLWLDQLVRRHD